MKTCTRRIISFVAALTLLVTCLITGLVLPTAATDVAQNLVPNGDFEQGAVATWTGVSSTVTVEDGVGYGGGKALQFAAGGAAEIYWKNFAPTLEANTSYELTFLAKGPQLRVSVNAKTDMTVETSYSKDLGNEWVTVRSKITTGAAPTLDKDWGLYFRRDNAAAAPSYIDNVVMVKRDEAGERFLGGNFDAIGATHWGAHLGASVGATVETEQDGNKALKIPGSTTAWDDKFVTNVNLTPGIDYTVSLVAKGAPINVLIYGASGQYATGGDSNEWKVTKQSDGYKKYTYTFTACDGLLETDDYLLNITRKTNETLTGEATYIDNVSIKQTVEPDPSILWTEDYESDTRANGVKGLAAKGEVTADPKGSTNNVLKLTAAASTTYNGGGMGMAKGKVYALSFDYMGGSVEVAFNGSKGFIGPLTVTYATTDDWKTVTSYIITTDTLVNDGYSMNFTAPVGTCFDNFQLKEVGSKQTINTLEGGLLLGGDFEMPNAQNWMAIFDAASAAGDEAAIVSDPVKADNKVLHFPSTYGKGAYWYNQELGLEANTTYVLTADVYGDAVWGYLNGAKGIATGNDWFKLSADGNAWKTVTHTFTTGATVSNDTFVLGFGLDINTSEGAYVDNIRIAKVQVLNGITLNKTTATVKVGDTVDLTVTADPTDADISALTWESNNEAVATVANGVVTAVAAGTATITAKVGDVSATCTVTVEAVDTSILVDEDFEEGAKGVFAGATDTSTSWNVVDGGVGGGKALAITYENGDRWFKWNTLTFEPSTRYSITFLAKGPQVRLGVYKFSGSVDVKGDSFNLYTNPYQDDWTSYRLEFTTGENGFGYDPANAGYGMFFNRASALADTTEVTLIDNFKIQKTDETTDRIIGGDFTYPGMQQWRSKHLNNTADGYVVVADPADPTNKVLKIPASTGNLGDNYLQYVYLEAGLTYEISFKAKGAPFGIYMPKKQTTGGSLTADTWFHTEATTDWKTYTYDFTTTSNAAAYAEASWILNISRNMDVTEDTYVDDFSIIVKEIPNATGITLEKTEVSLGVNATETLKVNAVPVGSKYDSLTWKSSDETVATVVDGVVTALKTGTATITATAMVGDTPLTATCTVKVVVKATSFEIVQDALHLAPATNNNRLFVYETLKLKTEPADADISALTWKSSDETVAKVENGTVQALAAGTATITVTDGTLSDTITVTVDDMGERITGGTFEDDDWKISTYWTNGIIKDGSCSLVPDPTNADNTVLLVPAETQAKWMWPAHVDAGVSYKLTFKAKSAVGKATVHITPSYVQPGSDSNWVVRSISTEEWTEVSYIFTTVTSGLNRNYLFGFGTNADKNVMYIDDVSLVKLPAATSIALENTTIGGGESKTLTVTATPAASNVGTLTWESSDPSIISVDQNGKVTAVAGEGSVTITAKTADGSLTATCTVTITGDYATAIGLNVSSYYAKKNSTLQLTMTPTPVNGLYKKPVWTSSDETIATVDQNGLVTIADKTGEITITVTSGTLSATCKVIVAGAASSFEIKNETLVLASPRDTNKITKTLTIVTTPPNADPGELTWTSSNETVATVDATGKVTALADGETTITVKNADGSISDTCVVKVAWDGERIIGGDFENSDWVGAKIWTTNLIKDGCGSVVADPTNAENLVMALPNPDNGKLDALWLANLHVNAGKTYKLTFKVKGDGVTESQQLATYFHPTSVSLNGWKYNSNLTGEWKEVTYIFSTNSLDDGTSQALNRNYCLGFDNAKQGLVYVDDVSLVELPEATAIVLPEEDVELWPTGSLTISAGTVPAEASAGKLTWTSSDPNVVAVDANGKLTALADSGEVTITVTTEKGLTDTVKVIINEYANLIENGDFELGDLNWPSHATIKPGVGKDGTAGMVLDNSGSGKQDFFFKGNLAVEPGTTYIVEWDYLATTDATFRLWAGKMGLSLYASEGDGTTWKHGSKVFTTPTTMGDVNSAALKGWVFSVTSDVEGAPPSIVDNITLRLYNSGVKAESIKLSQSSMMLMPGRTATLGIMAEPADGDVNKSVWTSSDENVATVEYGIVTAVGKGTATITATTRDGVSATCEVTVSGNPAFITNGTFDDANDTTWGMTGGTAIVPEAGVLKSNAASIAADGTLTYEIKNLQPETTYQLFVRYRSAAAGKLKMTLVNGEEDLLAGKTVDTAASWTKQTIEFVTGETVADTYTLTLSAVSGAPILVDNVFLSQKATLIDFVVNSLVWTDSEQVKPGTELLFAVTISNIGEDPVKAGSTISIDICMDSKPIQTIEHTFIGEFAGGDTEMIIGTVPWAAVAGDHVMSARVNSTLSVLESNVDNNNMVQTDLRVNDVILEVPELAEQAGFTTLGFSDDFNTLDTIDVGATGADGYKWYVRRPYGATTLTTEDYAIEDGVLIMKNVIPTYNMGFSSADVKSGRGYTWNKGYLEYRLRIPRPRKNEDGEVGVPAVWSLPLDKLMSVPGSDWVEMDWMEYWGIDKNRPGGYYTITLHDQGTNENDEQIWYNKNRNYSKEGLGDGEWHTMAFLWVEDLLVGYLDDEEVFRLAYNENSFSDPMQSTIMADDRGGIGAFSYMNIQELVLHLGGSKDNPMEMDYVRIWTGVDNGSFKPEIGGDDEEEEGEVTVDISAEDFWSNFCTDDYGDPITAIDENNYLYIIMGSEYWDLLSDERKAEINALLAAQGQPTFEELMEEATAFLEESPEAMAQVFLMTFFMDEEGNLITEATTDNYLAILLSAEVFIELDTETQLAILELMDAYGMPTYEELLTQALAIAEQEGMDIEDLPSVEDIVVPETGENTTWPIAVSVVMLISAAGLWISCKRRKA